MSCIELMKLKPDSYQSANLIQKYRSMHASGLFVSLVALLSPTNCYLFCIKYTIAGN